MNLNERISKVIEYSQFSSSEFADEIDVQRSSISHITSGRNKPSLEVIIKIKRRFPEILWDWLITGDGEMLAAEPLEKIENSEEKIQEIRPTALPDLYDIINNEIEKESVEKAELTKNSNSRETNISHEDKEKSKISNSQSLDFLSSNTKTQSVDNEKDKIKKIIILYESGKFESFEP